MKELNVRWRFADECPRIGCGERGVNVKIGRRWVRFREFATGAGGKVPVKVFESLKPRRLVSEFKPRRRFVAKPAPKPEA